MKTFSAPVLVVAFFAVVATASLREDFEQISALIPHQEIKEVTRHFLRNDVGVRHVFLYSSLSPIARRAYQDVANDTDVRALAHWIHEHLQETNQTSQGNDFVPQAKDAAHQPFGLDDLVAARGNQSLGGWPAYAKAIYDLIPTQQLYQLGVELYNEGGDFTELYKLIQSHREVYERLLQLRSVRVHLRILRFLQVDLAPLDHAIRKVFKWEN